MDKPAEDSIRKLRKKLQEAKELECVEAGIQRELKSIGFNFSQDAKDEGFYTSLVADSAIRTRKLGHYIKRYEGLIERLSAFLAPKVHGTQVYDWKTREWRDGFD